MYGRVVLDKETYWPPIQLVIERTDVRDYYCHNGTIAFRLQLHYIFKRVISCITIHRNEPISMVSLCFPFLFCVLKHIVI